MSGRSFLLLLVSIGTAIAIGDPSFPRAHAHARLRPRAMTGSMSYPVVAAVVGIVLLKP